MDTKTKQFWLQKLELFHGDQEACARWLAYTVRAGGIRECRAVLAQAVAEAA